jgi:hypothetical protein
MRYLLLLFLCSFPLTALQTKEPPTWDEKVASAKGHFVEFFRLKSIPRVVSPEVIDGALEVVRHGEHRDHLLSVLRSRVTECRTFSSLSESRKSIDVTISGGRDGSEFGYMVMFAIGDDGLVEKWFIVEETFNR